MLINTLKAVARLIVFLCWTLLNLLLLMIALPFNKRLSITRLWHTGCLKIFAIRLAIKGSPSDQSPTIYIANHVSYLDINILGSLLKASFVSKAQIRQWPVFGWLSTLQNTVFINRRSRDITIQLAQLSDRVDRGDSLIVFPEGTSTDGKTVKSFKSSLLAISDLYPQLPIQPVSLRYLDKHGGVLGDEQRDHYAFYADFPFAAHFWNMLKGPGIRVDVVFSERVTGQDFLNRKDLTVYTHQQIIQSFTGEV